jgi:hypothetical protein
MNNGKCGVIRRRFIEWRSSVSNVVARQTLYRWYRKSECAEEGEDPVLAKSRESRFRSEIRDLKRLLAEKVLEVDFFKGALQQIESRHRENSGSGRPTFTSTSGT